MDKEIKNLDRVVEPVRSAMPGYAEEIHRIFSDNAISLSLFGAAASGAFDKDRHTARNALILKVVDLEMLRELARSGAKLGKAAIAAPLIMTPEYIEVSLDTFPLEFMEIQQCHITIFGPDHFDKLSFENAHIRYECERELKTILIGMRQGLLATAGREKFIAKVDEDVSERLIRTLRGILWLRGIQEPHPGARVIAEVEKQLDQSLPGLTRALSSTDSGDWEEFQALYADVEVLRRIVDEM